ncbi:hypothetical protein K7X08_037111 [Anisodus acutangulus]|uniref:Pentatricopeptide repeat-containing protein n=1 Tax=Anisodus acutangulus TaxID=402998 RepID=A0A9Q1QWY8_9SOLA|nr:hypothetical protein K7X08_037111 [Anisodus acutangulus]
MGRVKDADKLFEKIPERNVVIWIEGFKTWSISHGLIVKLGLEDNSFVGTSFIEFYAKCGNISESCKIFENLNSQGLVPWNAMISAFVHNGLYKEAFLLFNRFRKSGLFPNSMIVMALSQICVAMESKCLCESVHALVVKLGLVFDVQVNNSFLFLYSSLMELASSRKIFNTMSSTGNLKMGKSVHTEVITHGFGTELPLLNAMITMYARSEDLNSSRTVFDRSTMKSMVSWTSIISGLLHNGRPKEALDMFIRVRIEENFFTDSVLLVSALTAAGEMVVLELCMQLHCHTIKAGF